MAINPRLRGVIIAGTSLAVIAGVGIGVATASPATQTRYVTASAGNGDVTQTYTATGTITRTHTSDASFSVDGTVSSVKVAVGDTVEAGQLLAVLKKGPLQLAVLDAETSVAEAKATLYAAQNPSSSTSGGSSASRSATSSSSSSSGSGSSGGGRTVTIDPTALLAATSAVTKAVADEQTACAPVFGAVPGPQPTATASPSGTPRPTSSPTVSATPTPTETPTATESASAAPSATETVPGKAVPSATIKDQQDTIESNDPTPAELKACGEARAQVNITTRNLQTLVQQLVRPGGSKASGGTGSSSTKTSGSKVSSASATSSSNSTATVSAAQVASAKAKLLSAQQQLQAAQDALDNAELLAPIAGTVELTAGNAASAGSITIVGSGSAQVSVELPLKTRAVIKAGQQVSVMPAGSTRTLSGKVTSISAVETSGTAGDSPTYTTLVTVSDPDGLLASGAKASVTIPAAAATNVVRVPASAVTPTGTGTATVSVLEAGAQTAKTVEVTTGAVGGGWVQINSGLTAGQKVVLADNTAALPSNTSNNRRTTTSTTRASASASAQPGGGSSAQPSPAPSATASR